MRASPYAARGGNLWAVRYIKVTMGLHVHIPTEHQLSHSSSNMKLLTVLTLTAFAGVSLAASDLVVITPPALYTCENATLEWSGGQSPFFPAIINGGEVAAPPIEYLLSTTKHKETWLVNIAAGTPINIRVTEARGYVSYSAEVTIQAGSSTSCLPAANPDA